MVNTDELWQALLALGTVIIPIGLAWLMLQWHGQSDRHRNADKQK